MKKEIKLKITETPEFNRWLKLNRRCGNLPETSYNKFKNTEKKRDVFMVATFLSLIALIVVLTLSVLPLSAIQ